jgi:hypothetical protein
VQPGRGERLQAFGDGDVDARPLPASRADLRAFSSARRSRTLGAIIVASSPYEFQAYIKSETEKWEQVAKKNNIRGD